MAVTAQAGIFGFGPQAEMETAATQFWKHKATLIDLGVNDDIRVGPMEIGSGPFPTFPYKAGYVVGGGVELMPRLHDSLGWLLYATLGDCDTAVSHTNNVYTHTFTPLAADQSFVRWLSLRKYIPMKEGDPDTDIGELYTDVKPVGLTLTLPNDSPITARWDFIGREFTLVDSISGWSWQNANYENWDSIPVGCELGGFIKFTGGGLTGEELPVVGARVTFANQNLDIRQEKVYGSPALEDITIIQRQITFDCTIKWNNPELYKAILTGSRVGSAWSSSPMTGSMDVAMVGTGIAGSGGTQKYQLNIAAQNIMWQMNGPIQLAGGQAIIARFTGTALEPTSGDYAQFILKNEAASYSWPSAGS
jgi:hypothetical protein